MIVSDAQPIQFWDINEPTFNEQINAFIDTRPYVHEVQANDTQKFQVVDNILTNSCVLKILDCDENLIEQIDYVKTSHLIPITPALQFGNTTFGGGSRSPWITDIIDDAAEWIWQSDGVILADGSSPIKFASNILAQQRQSNPDLGWPPGNYTIRVQGINHSSFTPVIGGGIFTLIYGYRNGIEENVGGSVSLNLITATGYFDVFVSFTLVDYYQYIGIKQGFNNDSAPNYYKVEINEIDLTDAPSNDVNYNVFDLSITGSGLSIPITDQIVKFRIGLRQPHTYTDQGGFLASSSNLPVPSDIWDIWLITGNGKIDGVTLINGKYLIALTATPESKSDWYVGDLGDESIDVKKSDPIKFVSQVINSQAWGSRLIFYKSDNNFAGIKYPNDGGYFSLRVPSRFYKPRNVKTTTSLGLSQSNIITTSQSLTKQKLFKTILLPQYILDKIELIFQHCVSGSVVIDGIEWQADESFDRNDVDERCAFDMASTWLSSGIVRNII